MISGVGALKLVGRAAIATVLMGALLLLVGALMPGQQRVAISVLGWFFSFACFPDGNVQVFIHAFMGDERGREYIPLKWATLITSTLSFAVAVTNGDLGSLRLPGPSVAWVAGITLSRFICWIPGFYRKLGPSNE